METLSQTTKETLDHLSQNISDRTHDAVKATREKLSDASERLADVSKDFSKSAKRTVKSLSASMKRHPMATVVIGVAVGYLFIRALRR